jgi:hypothetical protein
VFNTYDGGGRREEGKTTREGRGTMRCARRGRRKKRRGRRCGRPGGFLFIPNDEGVHVPRKGCVKTH